MSNIPDNIVFIYSNTSTVTRQVNGVSETAWVTPAFVSDAINQKTIQTGIAWAENDRWSRKKIMTAKMQQMVNEPRAGFKIFDLSVRAQGGRAYKVITPENFYIDFREDMLLESMFRDGIGVGGLMKGKYLFAKVGSQMKLILESSPLHREILGIKK